MKITTVFSSLVLAALLMPLVGGCCNEQDRQIRQLKIANNEQAKLLTEKDAEIARLGERIGQGESLDDILEGSAMVVEGIYTVKAAYQLSEQMGVDMPIAVAVYEVLYGWMAPALAARELMTRQPRAEDEA